MSNHNFTKSEKITILVVVVLASVLFAVAGFFFGKNKTQGSVVVEREENVILKRNNDSLNWVINARDKSIKKKDSLFSILAARQAVSDSFYIRNFIKNKNEIKYIENLDSIRRVNRIDSLLKRAGIRR